VVKKVSLAAILVFFIFSALTLQASSIRADSSSPPKIQSSKSFNYGTYCGINCMTSTTAGGYSLGGSVTQLGTPGETTSGMWLLKLDSSGSKVWAQGLSSVYINLGGIVSLAQAVDGGYLLAGEKVFGGSHLLKTDALGQVVWTQTYSNVSLESVTKTTDNEFVVAGTINDGTPDFWLPKISSSGAME
jgi:hypothetical protein